MDFPLADQDAGGGAAPAPLQVPELASVAAAVGFVHLHVHSAFSLREGALSIGKLAKLAVADAMPALAITDSNNLFGALEFSEKLAKEGVQPIIGIELTLDFGDGSRLSPRGDETGAGRAGIVLLAKDETGYRNLMHLASRAWLNPEPGDLPHLPIAALPARTDGLLALTGGPDGPLDRCFALGRPEAAERRLDILQQCFGGGLYIELQRHGLAQEREVEPQLIDLAFHRSLPLVASNEPYFAGVDDYEAHDALLCIAEGTVIGEAARRQLSPEHRFKTRAEMALVFADLPEALANSVEAALRCAYRPLTRKPILPRFSSTAGDSESEAAELIRQAEAGLAARLAKRGLAPGLGETDYRARLAFELDVIIKMQFPGYFLIVSDFIKFAKKNGIPVGPGAAPVPARSSPMP